MNLIDAYVAELRAALSDRLPPAITEARLRELRAHLIAAAEEMGETEALRRFGSPRANAQDLIRQARGYDTKSAASLSLAPGGALTTSVLVGGLWSAYAMTFPALQWSAWLPFLAVLLFSARCYQTRRWLAIPAAAWSAIGIALVFVALSLVPPRLDPNSEAGHLGSLRGAVRVWDRNAQEVAGWRAGHPPMGTEIYVWRSPTETYVWGLPVPVRTLSEPIYSVARHDAPDSYTEESRSSVRESWRRYGNAWANTVAHERESARRYLAEAESGRMYPWAPVPERVRSWAIGTFRIALILLVFNTLALALGRFADWFPSRSRPAWS